jgi:bifunctional pyridoxal-dependent enzyme with beta-cystathionase and maltose regulon repressor activities
MIKKSVTQLYNEDIFNTASIEGMLASTQDKWHRYPSDVIGMWLADPDFPHAPFIKKALHDAVDAGDLYYSSEILTKDAMIEKIKRKNSLTIDRNDLYIHPGVIAGMWFGIQISHAKPGDEIILNDPMYQHFYQQTRDANLKPAYWKLDDEQGYRFDEEELKKIVTPRSKLIFVCNPHNPTGRVMTKQELKALADCAVDHKIPVMVDELWEDIVFDGRKHITLASLSPEIADLTITTWGISKTWGIPGLQCGYTVATNKKIMEDIKKCSAEVYHGATTLGRAAARVVLDEKSEYWIRGIMKQLHKTRAIATRRLTEIGCKVPELQGTYLMLPRFNVKMSHDELFNFILEKAKVGLQSGTDFGPSGAMHLRMTIATSEVILNEALDRIERALQKTLK